MSDTTPTPPLTAPAPQAEAVRPEIDIKTLKENIVTAQEALEAISTDPAVNAIAQQARSRISGVTPLNDEVDAEGARLTLKVTTALRAIEKLMNEGKATSKDPEITKEIVAAWYRDLEMNGPTKVFRIHQRLGDIFRNIEITG